MDSENIMYDIKDEDNITAGDVVKMVMIDQGGAHNVAIYVTDVIKSNKDQIKVLQETQEQIILDHKVKMDQVLRD